MYVPDSPSDLCRMLQLQPDFEQIELMEHIARQRGLCDVRFRKEGTDEWDGTVLRAACMVVLWRTLRVQGSRSTVIAPSAGEQVSSGELGHLAMGFLAEVCKTKDAVLASICSLKAWHCIEFGGETGWEVRFVHNVPSIVAESARRSLTGLIIDAGDAESALGPAAKALEELAKEPRALVIRLW